VLQEIFGAPMLDPERQRPSFANRSSWGDAELDTAEFARNAFGHGWHLDRHAFDESLLDRLRTLDVSVRSPSRVARQAWTGDHWQIVPDDRSGSTLRASAIVDATGRRARIARSQGARRYRLDGLVATYWLLAAGDAQDQDCTTLTEAVPDGWWYTTPVSARQRVVAYLTDSDLLPGRAARTASDWNERLVHAQHIREALTDAGCRLHDGPAIVEAGVAYLDHPSGCGWIAAGDAAVSFDPLSSQGILTSLVMGQGAGHALAAMLTRRDQQPLIRWGAEYARLLESHLRLRAAYYALERRWPNAPFWARRAARPPTGETDRAATPTASIAFRNTRTLSVGE
jgi:flavin-dependent dehydrogenase